MLASGTPALRLSFSVCTENPYGQKIERQEAWAVSAFGVASPPVVRYSFATINCAHRGLDGRGKLMDLARILAYVTGRL